MLRFKYHAVFKETMKKKPNKIALERTEILKKEADSTKDQSLANRYAFLIKKIAQKVQLKLPRSTKRRICKHCNTFLKPGLNCRVRLTKGKLVYHCQNCNKNMRFPY